MKMNYLFKETIFELFSLLITKPLKNLNLFPKLIKYSIIY